MRNKSFIFEFEQKRTKFEEKLEQSILHFFEENKEGTTYQINNYVRNHFVEFKNLYKESRVKGLYRLRKILKNLWKRGILKRDDYFAIGQIGRFAFPTHNWTLLRRIKMSEGS